MTALRWVCDATEAVSRGLMGFGIAAIVAITLVSVWYRYVLNSPLSWTEQVCGIVFVWITFLGAAVLYRRMLHIAVDMLVVGLPAPLQRAVGWVNQALVLLLAGMMLWFGGNHALDNIGQTYGALEISPSTFYFAAPVCAVLLILYWVEKLADPAFRVRHGEIHL